MDNIIFDQKILEEEIQNARQAALIANTREPRAESAYYDWRTGKITIDLKYGVSFSFPPEIAQGLVGASAEDLAEVEITPSGAGLHWEKLDADLSIPALLIGIYGNEAWMNQLEDKQNYFKNC